jgi:oligoribonuclease (3'-5' exoribonuclease)
MWVKRRSELCLADEGTESAWRLQAAHTAMADIRESVEQLRYYKGAIFKQQRATRGGR